MPRLGTLLSDNARYLRGLTRLGRAQPRVSVATLGCLLLAMLSACTAPGRNFAELTDGVTDGGGSSSATSAIVAAASLTSGATSLPSGSIAASSSTAMSSAVPDGSHTQQVPDGGVPCTSAATLCPEATDCRSYSAADCANPGMNDACEVTDAAPDTPCDNGNGKCDGNGECVVPNLAALGDACDSDDACGSHHCAASLSGDKICCDTACDRECGVCSAQGHCDVIPVDDDACDALACDESTECTHYPPPLSAGSCASFGQCATTDSYCVADFVDADVDCGDGLVCDGSGACVVDCPDVSGPERVCTAACPCDVAQGVCADNSECLAGLVCTSDAEAKLGFPAPSCLPEHCINNQQDMNETSVDCGDGCGCRASYEVVVISGTPGDATFGQLNAMSGDGSAFAGTIYRGGSAHFTPPYPARIDASGVVAELSALGSYGTAFGINPDGTVLVGDLYCDEPPDCAVATMYRPFRWRNGEDPEAVFYAGTALVVSATGSIVAGSQYDPNSGLTYGFRGSNTTFLDIPELDTVVAMSADGEYIAGRSSLADEGAIWSATQGDVIALSPPSAWTSWGIEVLSDNGSVFAGTAYTSGASKPYLYRDGTFSDFPELPGADTTHVSGMNSDGSVTVGSSGTGSINRAFLWDETNGIRTVLAEVAARGIELPVDLELTDVSFLSDNGRVIVGWVYNADAPSFWRVTLDP